MVTQYSMTFNVFMDITANEEEDYEAIPATKELGCGATMCVPITIVDDDMVENEENLIISLSTNSRRITVDPNSRYLEIIINDNDGESESLEQVIVMSYSSLLL